MRVLQRFTIDCDADAAWRALHSPRAVTELYGPLIGLAPLDPEGLPTSWRPGDEVAVALSLGGAALSTVAAPGGRGTGIPVGRQLIHVSDVAVTDPRDGTPVRILRDSGIPISGPLAGLDVWDHQIAVSPAPGDPAKALWRDRLVIGGAVAPVLWPVLWSVWQWRATRVRALAPSWAHDPEHDPEV